MCYPRFIHLAGPCISYIDGIVCCFDGPCNDSKSFSILRGQIDTHNDADCCVCAIRNVKQLGFEQTNGYLYLHQAAVPLVRVEPVF
jgi:hypothetical protein